jgi:hypothetical protein
MSKRKTSGTLEINKKYKEDYPIKDEQKYTFSEKCINKTIVSKYLDDLFKFMESSVNKYFILINKNINMRVKCLEFNKVINVEPNEFDKKNYEIFGPTSYYWETKKAAIMVFYEENMKVHFPIHVVDLDSFFFLENVETRKIFSSESYNPKTVNCIG